MIKDLNVRPEIIKLLEENIGRTLNDINQSKILYDPPPRVMEIKTKVNKWDLIKLKSLCTHTKKSLCTEKGAIGKVIRQPSEWDKIIANETTDTGLILKNIQVAHITQYHKNKQPNQKVGKTDISPKKTYRWLTNT